MYRGKFKPYESNPSKIDFTYEYEDIFVPLIIYYVINLFIAMPSFWPPL